MIIDKIADMETLMAAWENVRTKKPPPGIDRVTWEIFEKDLSFNLQKLQRQLKNESYQPLPVIVYKDTRTKKKGRNIGISSMRDKVVQQAVLRVLTPRFEEIFLPCCYAYRPKKSAISAVIKVDQLIKAGNLWALQMDIKDFFDTMDHAILLDLVRSVIDEKPVIRLISKLLKARIFKEMGLFDNVSGSHQGSGLSPLLSNIYLDPLDKLLWKRYKDRYIRYSDDIMLLGTDKKELENAKIEIEKSLEILKLSVSPHKTSITHVAEGIVYLGFFMDAAGRGPDKKSVEQLQSRLEKFEKVRKTDDVLEKIDEAAAIIRGWYNYYGTLKPIDPQNIISLIALVRLSREYDESQLGRRLLKQSSMFSFKHPELFLQLGYLFESFGMQNHAVRQYAQALQIDPDLERAKEKIRSIQEGDEDLHGAIEKIQHVLHFNPHYKEGYEKLAEYYTRLGLYGFAEKAHAKALELDSEDVDPGPSLETSESCIHPEDSPEFDYRTVDVEVFLNLFKGRLDAHAKQWVDERGRWGFLRVERGLKRKDVLKHLKGKETLAVYPVTKRDTVNFIVFDVDTAKRIIIQSADVCPEAFIRRAQEDIVRLKTVCEEIGLSMYIEDSGYKGRHGWVFFDEEISAVKAIRIGQQIMKTAGGPSKGMVWELFPMGKTERHKSIIKLPLGINKKNNRRCLFLSEEGVPVRDQSLYLKTMERATSTEISEIEIRLFGGTRSDKQQIAASPALMKMVDNCKVISHLINKARETNYLNHYERICLLYTLTFAGQEGCDLLHKVISWCINYDYNFTQRQIERRKDSPMSCAKIQENFPHLAETLPCDCKFQIPPRGYPSPVLYILEAEMEEADGPQDIFKGSEDEVAKRDGGENPELNDEEGTDVVILDFEKIFSDEIPHTLEGDRVSAKEDSEQEPLPKIERNEKEEHGQQEDDIGNEQILPIPHLKDIGDEALKLFMEYMELNKQISETRKQLKEVEIRLGQIFDKHGGELSLGTAGILKRVVEDNGRTRWILSIG